MERVNKEEMKSVLGGWDFNASFLSALIRGVNSFMDVGRSIGSAFRRIYERKVCPL